jgi:transcriptional regulator with XRE-family HTH domain
MNQASKAIQFGSRLQAIMRAKKIPLSKVAEELEVGVSTIRKICSGSNVSQYLQLEKLASVVGVSPNELLGYGAPDGECAYIRAAVQGVIEQLGHDRETARLAAEIALQAAQERSILQEDAETETRVKAKILLSQAGRLKSK